MQQLELKDGALVRREDPSLGRIENVSNDRDLAVNPVQFDRVDVIVLNFPAFKDGRAFTQARTLREQGFSGDIRATGGLFLDQMGFAIRCGFTSFDLETEDSLEGFRASVGRYARHYQKVGSTHPARGAQS